MTSPAAHSSIALAVERVRSRISAACERAGRDPASVTLIAVTKTRPAADIVEALNAGVQDFGENYVQEGRPKFEQAAALCDNSPPFTRHFIGHLQRNKVSEAVDAFDVFHGIDSLRLLEAVGHRSTRTVPVFIQVNLAAEQSKGGAPLSDVAALINHARTMESVTLLGLMAIPPVGAPEEARPWFRRLAELARVHGLSHLSMGMSEDFEVAIEERATHIRVGRALFGERQS